VDSFTIITRVPSPSSRGGAPYPPAGPAFGHDGLAPGWIAAGCTSVESWGPRAVTADWTVAGDGVVRLVDGSEIRASTNGDVGAVSIGVRPEKIRLGETGVNTLSGTVKESAYIGVATEVVVATPVGELTVFHQNVEAGGGAPAPGSQVTLSWASEATFVVDRGEEKPE